MSLMAGFDFLAEISKEPLLKLIKTQFTIQGTPANPPFEIDLPIDAVNGNAHIIVNDLLLDLTDDDRVTLTLKFNNSSVIGQSPAVSVLALAGEITIKASILLTSVASLPTQRVLAFDLSSYLFDPEASAVVDLEFTTSDDEIDAALAGTGISVETFKSQAQQTVESFVHGMGVVPFNGVAFTVVPGVNGMLTPTLTFERLEAHCIGNQDPKKQALGLFGILLLANHSKGNHTKKTATAITPGHEVAISFSPGVFHSLQICPTFASKLGVAIGSLPGTCGTASGVDKDGVTITSLSDSFASGHVDINGSFEQSGFCYDANGSFHGTLTFALSGNTLTPTVHMDEPDVEFELDWECVLAGLVTGGAVGGIVGLAVSAIIQAIINAIGEAIGDDMGQTAVEEALGTGLSGVAIPAFAGALFDAVSVTSEGLTIQGVVPMFVPFESPIPSLDLSGSVTTSDTKDLSEGTYHYPGLLMFCEAKDFPYTEKAQNQTATYRAIPKLLGQPLKLEWWLSSYTTPTGGVNTPISGNSGTVSLPEHTFYPFPLDSGGHFMDQPVHLEYLISDDVIQLKNTPSEGNYSLDLHCKATDPLGNVAEAVQYVTFEGNIVEFGGGYEEYVSECHAKGSRYWHEFAGANAESARYIPKWVPINNPPSEKLMELLYALAASPAPEAQVVLAQTITAHRSSFLRAVSDLQAGKIGFEKGEIVAK